MHGYGFPQRAPALSYSILVAFVLEHVMCSPVCFAWDAQRLLLAEELTGTQVMSHRQP